MLRNSADYRSIGLLTLALGLEVAAIVYFHDVPAFTLAPLLLVLILAVFTAALINHNHRHLEIFYSPMLNRIVNYILTVAMGAPSTRLHVIHMRNHHKSYRTTDDWSHYSLARNRRGLWRTLTYYTNAAYLIALNRKSLELTSDERHELHVEYVVLFLWLMGWLTFDFKAASIVLAVSYLGGQFLLLVGNLINHDHCDLSSPYNCARTFDSRFENWIFLNHGFHSVHHRQTTLHWSRLRQVHESQFLEKSDPALQSNSFLLYFFRHYILG